MIFHSDIHPDVCEFIEAMVGTGFPVPTSDMIEEFDKRYRLAKDTFDVFFIYDDPDWGKVNWATLKPTAPLDYKKISNIVLGGIDHSDYPDYCDAYIESADYDGRPMTDREIEDLNRDGDFVYKSVINHIF